MICDGMSDMQLAGFLKKLYLLFSGDEDVPSESQCRPYIEKALKELESGDSEPGTLNYT